MERALVLNEELKAFRRPEMDRLVVPSNVAVQVDHQIADSPGAFDAVERRCNARYAL
jgi:hypothetical protein